MEDPDSLSERIKLLIARLDRNEKLISECLGTVNKAAKVLLDDYPGNLPDVDERTLWEIKRSPLHELSGYDELHHQTQRILTVICSTTGYNKFITYKSLLRTISSGDDRRVLMELLTCKNLNDSQKNHIVRYLESLDGKR